MTNADYATGAQKKKTEISTQYDQRRAHAFSKTPKAAHHHRRHYIAKSGKTS